MQKLLITLAACGLLMSSMAQDVQAQTAYDLVALKQAGKQIKTQSIPQSPKKLVLITEPQLVNTSNGPDRGELLIQDQNNQFVKIADRVSHAKITKDGSIVFASDMQIFDFTNGKVKKLADEVNADFTFDPANERIFVTRRVDGDDFSQRIEILDRNGNTMISLVPPGLNSHPVLTPDGKHVLYMGGDTGIISWYIVDVHGQNNRQLTNIGKTTIDASFVPVLSTDIGAGFIDDRHYEYRDVNDVWQLDIVTGQAKKVRTIKE